MARERADVFFVSRSVLPRPEAREIRLVDRKPAGGAARPALRLQATDSKQAISGGETTRQGTAGAAAGAGAFLRVVGRRLGRRALRCAGPEHPSTLPEEPEHALRVRSRPSGRPVEGKFAAMQGRRGRRLVTRGIVAGGQCMFRLQPSDANSGATLPEPHHRRTPPRSRTLPAQNDFVDRGKRARALGRRRPGFDFFRAPDHGRPARTGSAPWQAIPRTPPRDGKKRKEKTIRPVRLLPWASSH